MDLRCDGIVKDDVHTTVMDLSDRFSPCVNVAKVLIQQSGIQSRVTIRTPWLVHQNRSCKVNGLLMLASFRYGQAKKDESLP